MGFRIRRKRIGAPSIKLSNPVGDLLDARKARKEKILTSLTYAPFAGTVAGLAAAHYAPVQEKIVAALATMFGFTVASGVIPFLRSGKNVRKATMAVGRELSWAYKNHNGQIQALVNEYPYIIVDINGYLTGAKTNPSRLGIGRFRLESKKIRNGYYLEEVD